MRIARAGRTMRKRPEDAVRAELDDARRRYAECRIADYIRDTVAKAPPLTDDQKARLALILTTSEPSAGASTAA